jgi:hypothetical protein
LVAISDRLRLLGLLAASLVLTMAAAAEKSRSPSTNEGSTRSMPSTRPQPSEAPSTPATS